MKYLKFLGYVFGLIIVLTLFITILNFIGLIKGDLLNIFKLIIPLVSLFVGGFIIGKNSVNKGWLNGIKIGVISIIIFVLISLISKANIGIKNIIYYLILLSVSIFSSMVGISKKDSK